MRYWDLSEKGDGSPTRTGPLIHAGVDREIHQDLILSTHVPQ